MSDEIQTWVQQAKAGNYAAASALVGACYEKIYGYFRRLSGSDEDAGDLTQKTFCKAWQSLASYKGSSAFPTWLHSIAHHVYVDWRRVKNPADAQPDDWWADCVAEGPSPFESTADRDQADQLYRAVDELPEEQRQAIHLHYYQALSLQETADTLGIATSTLKYRLRQALAALESRLPKDKLHA